MHARIDRAEALARIRREGGDFGCLMCALRDGRFGSLLMLHEDADALVLLPRYVTRWGHVLVVLRPHVTRFSGLAPGAWQHLCALAHHAAVAAEEVIQPRRCFIASTGSSGGELTQTSEHLHLHVLPITDADDRPGRVFSWDEGVIDASDEAWASLRQRYAEVWARLDVAPMR